MSNPTKPQPIIIYKQSEKGLNLYNLFTSLSGTLMFWLIFLNSSNPITYISFVFFLFVLLSFYLNYREFKRLRNPEPEQPIPEYTK